MALSPRLTERAAFVAEIISHPQSREILRTSSATIAKRLFLSSLLLTPGVPEAFFKHFILKPYERLGSVIGKGATALVVRDSQTTVRKFFLGTDHMTETKQQEMLSSWEAKQAISLTHMPQFVVPQQFSLDEHPLFPERGSIVTATQEFIPHSESIDIYDESFRRHLWFPAAFVEASWAMYQDDNSALPDVVGIDNVIIDEAGNVKLIDPIVLTAEDDGPYYQKAARAFNFPERP